MDTGQSDYVWRLEEVLMATSKEYLVSTLIFGILMFLCGYNIGYGRADSAMHRLLNRQGMALFCTETTSGNLDTCKIEQVEEYKGK